MEASVILKMVEAELYNSFFIIKFIVRNNDRKIQAVIKFLYNFAWVQFMKSSKEKYMRKFQSYTSLNICPIAWSLYKRRYSSLPTKVRFRDVDAPEHMLSESRKIEGTW